MKEYAIPIGTNKELSELVQNELFKVGFKWSSLIHNGKPLFTGGTMLQLNHNGENLITADIFFTPNSILINPYDILKDVYSLKLDGAKERPKVDKDNPPEGYVLITAEEKTKFKKPKGCKYWWVEQAIWDDSSMTEYSNFQYARPATSQLELKYVDLTLAQIAAKYNISVEQLRIKE